MTYSNGIWCSHPCANPFNTRLGPSNYTLNPYGQGNPVVGPLSFNPNKKELPEPFFIKKGAQCVPSSELHTPDPVKNLNGKPTVQSIGNDIFRLADGTIIDLKTKKILKDPQTQALKRGEWAKTTTDLVGETEFEDLLPSTYSQSQNSSNSVELVYNEIKSRKYWEYAEQQSQKMLANQTPEQIKMLNDILAAFPKSKFEDEINGQK